MPDNPIKHDDLIQPGNPFDKANKGLQEMIKLTDQLIKKYKKDAKALISTLEKLNTATKEGRKATQNAANAVKKLSAQEKEALRIKKSLEREQAKLNQMGTAEYKQLIKTKDAINRKNAEMRKAARAMATGVKSTNKWSKALGSFQFKFNALGNIAANVVSRLTQAFKDFIKSSIDMAAKLQGVERAFRNLGRPGLLRDLQKATRGTVDNLKLMQAAVQAKNFKIPLEQLATYFEFATGRAIQTGESVDYLVQSLITGLGRKSILILDNLGISAVELAKEVKKVGDFGLAAGNIIQREMEAAGKIADSTATKIARVTTAWTNLKLVAGEQITTGFMARGASAAMERFAKAFGSKGTIDSVTKFMEFFETIKDLSVEKQAAALSERIETIKTSIEDYAKKYQRYDKLVEESRGREKKSYKESRDLIYDIQTENVALLRVYEEQLKALENQKAVKEDISDEEEFKLPEIAEIKKGFIDPLKDEFAGFYADLDAFGFDMTDIILGDPEEQKRKTKEYFERLAKLFADGMGEVEGESEKSWEEIEDIINKSLSTTADIVGQFTDIFAAQKAKELSIVGDNAKKREAIEKKYAKREQQMAIVSAIIDTAQGIMKVIGDYGLPWGLIPAAAVAALGAVQIATISGQEFAEGGSGLLGDMGGVLPGRRHSQGGVNLGEIGEAERGEYFGIVNRQMAKKYAGELPGIFDSLNNGAFHEIWARPVHDDPYTKKMYELMRNTPQIVPDGDRIERYPDGRTRHVRSG